MAEVLSPTSHFDGMSGYGSNLFLPNDTSPRNSSIIDPNTLFSNEFDDSILDTYPSTAPPSPELDRDGQLGHAGFSSIASSDSHGDDFAIEEDIVFPSYDDGGVLNSPIERRPSPPPPRPAVRMPPKLLKSSKPRRGRTSVETPPTSPPRSDSPQRPSDDSAVKAEPTRHVDYLSHSWREEDLWSSWRHVVARRKTYGEISRLENAAWRTWGKSQYSLQTVSPVELNWMKDHDTTWLYGPLQIGTALAKTSSSSPEIKQFSQTDSFTKPILKKRSLSEIVLRQSISSSTLIKQAIATLRSQSRSKPRGRSISQSQFSSDRDSSLDVLAPMDALSNNSPTAVGSSSTSGISTPCEQRHITFNDKVEQCIVIHDYKNEPITRYGVKSESDSDDEGVMMRPASGMEQKLDLIKSNALRNSFCGEEKKTIAKLPATTLKYWQNEPEPEPVEQATSPRPEFWEVGTQLVHSSSQETLKPANPSTNFLADEDEDEDEDEEDESWKTALAKKDTRRDSLFVHRSRTMRDLDEDDEEDYDLEYSEERYAASARKDYEKDSFNIHKSMQHTPVRHAEYEEDEDDIMAQGLFGKVIDTVNTARDIAHVIWNVGWQK